MRINLSQLPVSGKIGLTVIVFWLFIAVLGPFMAPHSGNAIVAWEVFEPVNSCLRTGTYIVNRTAWGKIETLR